MYKNEHNHEIDVIETADRRVCTDIKSKFTSSESMKRIIAQVFGVYTNKVLHKLPSTDATAQQIRCKRRKTSEHPPELSNIGFVIPPSSTTLQHGGSFFLYNSADKNRILTFSVKSNLELLATCGSWYIDSTFKIIPELFYQLMTVHGKTTRGSVADDGRKNSSENSCYAYIYCYFYVFTQLYRCLKQEDIFFLLCSSC